MDFYRSRSESHRFVVLAPSGTAAALLLGSTYHSFLGVPIDGQAAFRNETTNNAQVKTRLDGVESLNTQKDRINELGSVHFSAEAGQTLTDLYSIDRFGTLTAQVLT